MLYTTDDQRKLSERQREIYAYIREYILTYGVNPYIEEVSKYFALSRNGAQSTIDRLIRKGYLKRLKPKRTISYTLPDADFPQE